MLYCRDVCKSPVRAEIEEFFSDLAERRRGNMEILVRSREVKSEKNNQFQPDRTFAEVPVEAAPCGCSTSDEHTGSPLHVTCFYMTNGGYDSEQQQFERFYKLSKFWIGAKPILKRVGIGLLIVFDVIVVGWSAYRFIDYGVVGFFKERAMVGSIVNNIGTLQNISSARSAVPLRTKNAAAFGLGDDRADFYAEVSNPNKDWHASFMYRFVSSEGSTDFVKGFVLPGQSDKPLTDFAVSTTSAPRNVKLEITDVKWMRVNHHAIDDYEMWSDNRLDFDYSDVTFERQVHIVVEEGEPAVQDGFGRTMFTVKNNTAFGYWRPSFTIRLIRSGKVVGVTSTNITELEPGQKREIVVNWFGTVPASNETQIEPNIDIFDPDIYMPIRGEAQPDVRERIRIKR